jgi:hypothetical protein
MSPRIRPSEPERDDIGLLTLQPRTGSIVGDYVDLWDTTATTHRSKHRTLQASSHPFGGTAIDPTLA